MKAIVLTGEPGKAELVHDRPPPEVRPGYVLVDVKAVALNPTDRAHVDYLNTKDCLLGCDVSANPKMHLPVSSTQWVRTRAAKPPFELLYWPSHHLKVLNVANTSPPFSPHSTPAPSPPPATQPRTANPGPSATASAASPWAATTSTRRTAPSRSRLS